PGAHPTRAPGNRRSRSRGLEARAVRVSPLHGARPMRSINGVVCAVMLWGCSYQEASAPPDESVAESAITNCGLPQPTRQCNRTVCNTQTGIWEFEPLPLPRACDTFAGPGTGKC